MMSPTPRVNCRKLAAAVWALSVATLLSGISLAEDTTVSRRAEAAREKDRPHTLVELSTGFRVLPGATVCPQADRCYLGEFSVPLGIQNLYRFDRFGIGAGVEWATTLRSDSAAGSASLEREHSRSYFQAEALGRYYFVRTSAWDWWGAGMLGLVVVNDSWDVKADRKPYSDADLIGPRGATLGSEGVSLGLGLGGEWTFAPNWSLGPSLRYVNWILPSRRVQSPTRDVASLSGRLDVLAVGVRIGYRLAL